MDDVLVLRIENSKDFYIPVTTDYQRSCYGMSLEELVYTHEPVRNTRLPGSLQQWEDVSTNGIPQPTSTRLSIPKELWRLVDALWSSGAVREKDLFSTHVDPADVAKIRNSLDCGVDFPRMESHVYAEALVSFLAALPKPIIPSDMCPSVYNVFCYLNVMYVLMFVVLSFIV